MRERSTNLRREHRIDCAKVKFTDDIHEIYSFD